MAVFGLVLLSPFFYARHKTGPATAPVPTATGPKPSGFHALPVELAPVSEAFAPTQAASVLAPAPAQDIKLPCTFTFSYGDQHGDYSRRTVNVSGISSNGAHSYLEGFCHDRMDERTFRVDRIRGDLTDTDTGELVPVRRLLSGVLGRGAMTFRSAPAAPTPRAPKEWQTSVLFTGFASARREALEAIAEASGWDVRSTVGSTLDYLVAGPRGGPSKRAKAHELGIAVIDEDTFRALL